MADPRGANAASGRDLPGRGVHPAESDEGSRQAGILAILHLFHLADGEYLHSEKYELKTRDWDRTGNIKDYVGRLNRLRRANPALLQTGNLRFVAVDDDQVMGFVKESASRDNAVAVAIALSGARPREFWLHFGDLEIGRDGARTRVAAVENLVTGERHAIAWGGVRLNINPTEDPALLLRCLAR